MTSRKRNKSHKRPYPPRLPFILLASGAVLIVLALAFIFREPQRNTEIEATGRPSLKVDQELVDLGDVKLGVTVKTSFTLTNVGDRPLRFTQQPYVEVKEGC